jgi:hypothetical protein
MRGDKLYLLTGSDDFTAKVSQPASQQFLFPNMP